MEGPESSGGQLISAVCGDALRAGTPPSHGGSSLLRSCRSCSAQDAGLEAGHRAEGEGQGSLSPPTRPGPEPSEPCPPGPGARRHISALHPRGPAPNGHCASSFRAGVGHRARAPPAPGAPPARTPAPLDAPPNCPRPRYPYTSTRAPPSHPTHSAPPRTHIALATTHGPQAKTMPVRSSRWGCFWELRARQLQRQLQSWEVTGRDRRAETHALLREQMPWRGHSLSALTRLCLAAQKLKREMEALRSSSRGLLQSYREEYRDCLSEIVQAVQTAQLHCEALLAAYSAEAGRLEQSLRDVTERWQQELRERRRLQDALAELKGNIRVHCRIRPLLPFDDEAQEPVSPDSSVSGEVVHAVDDETVLVECNRPGHALINKTYTFERVYGPAESQRAVFEDVCPLLTSFLDGYNVCIMAYGQTGSGKSFTMLGPHCQEEPALPSEPRGDTGIVPRAAAELFRLISEDPSRSPEVGVSIVEIYNNDIFDLLAKDGCRAASGAKRQVLPTQQGKTVVCGLTYQSVRSAAQFLTLVGGGLKLRAKQPTAVHAESSRSHLVITVTLATAASRRGPSRRPSTPAPRSDRSASAEPCQPGPRSPATGRRQSPPVPLRTRGHGLGRAAPDRLGQVRATLQLVDLAGSECAGVSGVTGPALRETSCINRSLAALSDVLGALAEGRGHIPYRNSRLTHLLQDALGGDAKLQVIVCVSPGQRHMAETLQSLGFGARARQVERGHPAPRKLR